MATLVRNRHGTPITLPFPYSGVLMGGAAVVLPHEPATVVQRLGLGAEQAFELLMVPDSELLNSPVNGAYAPPASGKLFYYPGVAAKGTADIAGALPANSGKAYLSLAIGGSALDTVVEAKTAGSAGNTITVRAVGDSPGAGGVTITRVVAAITVHYESGVSTVANVVTAIGALTGGDALIEVLSPGTGATVLTAPGDNFIATPLAHGSDTGNVFTVASPATPRNLRVTMPTNWDGDDVTAVGFGQGHVAQTEVFTRGSNVVRVGVLVFEEVVRAYKSAAGVTTVEATIGTGDKLGVGFDPTGALLAADGVFEACTLDAANKAFTPTTLPNGTVAYALLLNVVQAP